MLIGTLSCQQLLVNMWKPIHPPVLYEDSKEQSREFLYV